MKFLQQRLQLSDSKFCFIQLVDAKLVFGPDAKL
jgi:hypothetical protein